MHAQGELKVSQPLLERRRAWSHAVNVVSGQKCPFLERRCRVAILLLALGPFTPISLQAYNQVLPSFLPNYQFVVWGGHVVQFFGCNATPKATI